MLELLAKKIDIEIVKKRWLGKCFPPVAEKNTVPNREVTLLRYYVKVISNVEAFRASILTISFIIAGCFCFILVFLFK